MRDAALCVRWLVLLLAATPMARAQAPQPAAARPSPSKPATSAGRKPAAAPPVEPNERTPIATPENPVFVDCDRGRMEGASRRFVCTGHVKMVRNTTTLTCERSVGHYLGKDATQITRLECFGNVEAVDGDRWARGEYADYDTVKEVLVLTGNPEARQGTNTMRGDKVVFYVDTDLIEVERVKGVLESKGKEPGQNKPVPAQRPAKAP
ncbi:MAG TPA: LptA/OstA family protein [Myxococcaceae bacterium]|nr:LptA/OstA family protein [Myxococcaceae bacterium]